MPKHLFTTTALLALAAPALAYAQGSPPPADAPAQAGTQDGVANSPPATQYTPPAAGSAGGDAPAAPQDSAAAAPSGT